MLPAIEGIIARRVLLNFWADPAIVQQHVPEPLQVEIQNGCAVVGICLIRLEKIRPRGMPAILGVSSENMAHRVAIKYPGKDGMRDGVYIWRRETDQGLVAAFGGRLFPGVHSRANFQIAESSAGLAMNVKSDDGSTDVALKLRNSKWHPTKLFKNFEDVCAFFAKGDCGFSCSLKGDKLEGMQLKTMRWEMSPLIAESVRSSFYDDRSRFPEGSIGFDCAVLMRGIPHEWHEITEIPEWAGAAQ